MKLGLPHRANGFHSPSDWPSLLADIDQRGEALKGQTQETLRKQGLALRYRAQSGESWMTCCRSLLRSCGKLRSDIWGCVIMTSSLSVVW